MKLDHFQLAIPKDSEPACLNFWCEVLGFEEREKPASLKHRGGVWINYGETEIHLGVEENFAPARKAHPAFSVPNLDAIADKLALAGHPIRWDNKIADRRRFFTDDAVGNRIEFLES